MFTKILVAIDGSKMSEKAVQTAVEEARVWNARVHILYVIETGLFSSLPMDNTWEVMYSMLEKEGNEALDRMKKIASDRGVGAEGHIRQGHAGTEILRAADEIGADLVVVGSHGKSNIDRLLLGSVSSFVVSNAKVSVTVVRP